MPRPSRYDLYRAWVLIRVAIALLWAVEHLHRVGWLGHRSVMRWIEWARALRRRARRLSWPR